MDRIVKKCRHGRGLKGAARRRAWQTCGCQWLISITVDAKREYVTLGADEDEAAARALELMAKHRRGTIRRAVKGTGFGVVADAWIRSVKTRPGVKHGYVQTMESRVRTLKLWWGDTQVTDIDVRLVREWLEDAAVKRAPNTVIGLYSCLRLVLGYAQDQELIGALPVPARSRVRKTKVRDDNHLGWEDCMRVIDALPAPYDAVGEVCLLTGLRVGEAVALTVDDVDVEAGVLAVRGTLSGNGVVSAPKTRHSRRAVRLSPRALDVVRAAVAQAGDDGRLFPVTSLGMTGYTMRKTLQELGLYRKGLGWHAFRHGHEALLEAAGVGIRDAAARLGHGPNFAQTMGYGWAAEAIDPVGLDETLVRLHRPATSEEGRGRLVGLRRGLASRQRSTG